MKVDIDFDLTCHFGNFKNLELTSRGIFCVSVSLFYGSSLQAVPPHGCFSAPLKHSSFVGDYELDAAPAIDMCEIQFNETESYFCTRTFVIRYREEFHEINEGAHWRITVPDFDLSRLDPDLHTISCTELLTMRFSLFHCDLENISASSDLLKNLHKHIPSEPEFKLFASQDIHLQHVGSGFHQYYPISFTKQLDVCLDVMIHCAITKIHVSDTAIDILLNESEHKGGVWYGGSDETLPIRENHYAHREHINGAQTSTNDDFLKESSVTEDKRNMKQSSSSTIVVPPLRSSGLLLGRVSRPSAPSSTWDSHSDPDELSKSGLRRGQVRKMWAAIASSLMNNVEEICAGVNSINSALKINSSDDEKSYPVDATFQNTVASTYDANEQSLLEQGTVAAVKSKVNEILTTYSEEVCRTWSQVTSLFTRHLKQVCNHLHQQNLLHMRAFWKGQCFVHTCSSLSVKLPRHTEESMCNLLTKTLHNEDSSLSLFGGESNDLNPNGRPLQRNSLTSAERNRADIKLIVPFARGLRVFDANVHKIPSKLPIMIVQQYSNLSNNESLEILRRGDVFQNSSISSNNCQSNTDVHMSHLKDAAKYMPSLSITSPSLNRGRRQTTGSSSSLGTGETVVDLSEVSSNILIDALPTSGNPSDLKSIGTSFDMKILKNAMKDEFKEDTLFLSSKYNECNSGDSLVKLGNRLATEIVDFISDKCPDMLLPGAGRVVFVGHSAGGLIIRKCLEDTRLRGLIDYDKLYSYISLSTPHLGTQYGESQLVATGMWALYKLKKSPLLQELALKDDAMVLYQLSENGKLQHFHRVIFVSSPKDLYVPLFSARVQVNSRAALDAKTGHIVVEMAANLMTQIEPGHLFRVTLDNQVDSLNMFDTMKNVDKMIGRSAHICYLEDKVVAMQLVKTLIGLLC